jgi:hypothetical protein
MLNFVVNILCHYWILGLLAFLPVTSASPPSTASTPFPDIPFSIFSHLIEENFSSDITLATVLTILLSLVHNTDMLNLHARLKTPFRPGERRHSVTSWMKAFVWSLEKHLGTTDDLFKSSEDVSNMTQETQITVISQKMDALVQNLGLTPYNQNGVFQGWLGAISDIKPVRLLCPTSAECETINCERSLRQATRDRDISYVTLCEGTQVYQKVAVLSGLCSGCNVCVHTSLAYISNPMLCQTRYYPDHERTSDSDDATIFSRVYLNSAKYLKIGQSLWVDRIFSSAVLKGFYNLHASASAYASFWNDSYGTILQVSRRQVWQAFIQESIRIIASSSDTLLTLQDNLSIHDVTAQAFSILGENGIIRSANQHECSECAHSYKATADIITGDDPAAVVGIDENRAVPALQGPEASDMPLAELPSEPDDAMDVDHAPVKMVVLDGIVMGHQVGLT